MLNYFRYAFAAIVIGSASVALAAPPATTTYFGSSWSGVGFVLGYGNEAAYVKYGCNGTDPGTGKDCDGPPRQGLIRKFTEIVDSVVAAAKFTSCKEVPTSGSKSVTADIGAVELTFGTPTQKIPSGWTGGGSAFDRRIAFTFTYSSITIKAVMEASCTYEKAGLMAMNMTVGSQAPGYERPINLWTGYKDGNVVADVYTVEKTSSGVVRGVYAYNVEINEAAKTYKLVGGQSTHFDTSDTASMDVLNVHGNFSTHQMSMRAKRFVISKGNSSTSNAIDTSGGIGAMSGSDDALLSSATGYALLTATQTTPTGPVDGAQGCVDFDTDTTAPTSNSACSGLDFLTTVPTPVVDSSGKFSAKWVLSTLKSKLVAIPSM